MGGSRKYKVSSYEQFPDLFELLLEACFAQCFSLFLSLSPVPDMFLTHFPDFYWQLVGLQFLLLF